MNVWKKIFRYSLPASVLLLGIPFIYFVVFEFLDFTLQNDKSFAMLLSAFGLIFGIFQVTLNLTIQQIRDKAQLRNTEYKEAIKILHSISQQLNTYLLSELKLEQMHAGVYSLETSLSSKINEFMGFVNINDRYLFKGIKENKVALEIEQLLNKMLHATDKLRFDFDELENKKNKSQQQNLDAFDTDKFILHMNFHAQQREDLISYNTLKYKLIGEIQKYLY